MKHSSLLLVILLTAASAFADPSSCLVIRENPGHRTRNAILAGVATGGIGAVPAATLSHGMTYKRVAAFGDVGKFRAKYSSGDLKKLDARGVQTIILTKEQELPDAAAACGFRQTAQPSPTLMQPAVAPMQPAPAPAAPAPLADNPRAPQCISSLVDRSGHEVCMLWSPAR